MQGEKVTKYMWSPRNNCMTVIASQGKKKLHVRYNKKSGEFSANFL